MFLICLFYKVWKSRTKSYSQLFKKFNVHKSKPHEICLNYFENFNLIYLQTLYSIFHYGWRKIIRPLCVWLLKSCLILISLGSTWILVLKIIFFNEWYQKCYTNIFVCISAWQTWFHWSCVRTWSSSCLSPCHFWSSWRFWTWAATTSKSWWVITVYLWYSHWFIVISNVFIIFQGFF